MTPTRLRVRLASTAALIALVTVGAALSATASPAPAGPSAQAATAVGYAVSRPVCNQPARVGYVRCFAFRRVDVAKGTKHSYSYVRPNGLTLGPAHGYTPALLASAYRFDPRLNRSNETVAIVDWYDDPLALTDLRAFDAHYRFPLDTAATFRKVNQRGLAAPLPVRDHGSATEIALDTQVVRAVCRTCKILLVEANSPNETDIAAAENTAVRLGATVVSNSFGGPEHALSPSLIAAYNHPGVVITASTGDDGWFGWDWTNQGYDSDGAASFPASSPYVVSVGGTSLTLNANGTRADETVWNRNGASDSVGLSQQASEGAAGGGCSKYFTAQPWQSHHAGYAAARCGGKRLSADVAALADPRYGFDVLDRYGAGKWITVGGTSVAAPLVAGLYALAGGAHGARYPSAAVYTNSETKTWSRYDVRTGGNAFCGGATTAACRDYLAGHTGVLGLGSVNNPNELPGGLKDCSFPANGQVSSTTAPSLNHACNAVWGFDGPSGVGAPSSTSLFLSAEPTLSYTRPTALHVHQVGTFTAKAVEIAPNTHVLNYTWRWGDGYRTTTTSTVAHHAYSHQGRFLVTLDVVDSRYQVVYRRMWVPVVA